MNECVSITASPTLAPIPVGNVESHLINEVGELWRTHSHSQISLSNTRDELKVIRTNLSQKLHELKSLLCRPGRGGAWSSFLEAQHIPRSTADRLVRGHEKSLAAEGGTNCATEQIAEPTEVTVRRYLHGLWPRLSRVLTTPEHVETFIAALTNIAEKSFAAADESSNSPASEDLCPDPAS